MMNDHSEEEFFVQLDSFQNFEQAWKQDLQKDMEHSGVSAEDISQYIKDAGPIVFGPTGNRSQVAKLNGFTRRFKEFAISTLGFLHEMDDTALQEGRPLNFGESEEDYATFSDRPRLAQKTKKKPTKEPAPKLTRTLMIALDVRLKLQGSRKVTRSFLVPIDMSFAALNDVLQAGLGWTDTHLHEFVFYTQRCSVGTISTDPYSRNSDLFGPGSLYDEETTPLSDFLPNVRRFSYFYDFGDAWEHIITVGELEYADGPPRAICTGGRGMTPPEDCGGAYGYAQLRKILKDPSHEEYEEHSIWAEYDFDGGFDLESVNEDLSEIVFTAQLREEFWD
ncbi:MAG: plasmid pRiA4b ORF-3 family protein [Sphaerochaeta sp.]|nr:plasmid pRiA4b ORF-3 family protein [Sphaerochaeta sp.]